MIQLRDLTDESGGTCDWGGCDEPTVAERHDPGHGWLAVCARHTGPRNKPSPGKALCPYCDKSYALTTHGRFRLHGDGIERCPGSGTAAGLAKTDAAAEPALPESRPLRGLNRWR